MATKQTGNPRPDRQYRLLPASPVAVNWDDVPDALIVELVRSYTTGGDAILFGTSKAQDVLAIRVYRGGDGYSVYTRGVDGIGEAVDRLHRYRPARKRHAERGAESGTVAQVSVLNNLPWHPLFTVNDLNKQRQKEIDRALEWERVVSSIPRHFYEVARQ
jgi:hypothetical protein